MEPDNRKRNGAAAPVAVSPSEGVEAAGRGFAGAALRSGMKFYSSTALVGGAIDGIGHMANNPKAEYLGLMIACVAGGGALGVTAKYAQRIRLLRKDNTKS